MSYANYQSGWCVACGRRRGSDGRCGNCDPWWTSPLVQVGGPILALGSLLLVVLLLSVSPVPQATRPTASNHSSGELPRSTMPSLLSASTPGFGNPEMSALSAPPVQTAVAPLPPIQLSPDVFRPLPTEDQLLINQMNQMRFLADSASAMSSQSREAGMSRESGTSVAKASQIEMSAQTTSY
jgi:hypothetical protein